MSDYRAPEVPTIQVDSGSSFDPNKMLLGLASQIATKVISDQFYESRREKITDDSQELLNINTSMGDVLKMNDPVQLKIESENLQNIIDSRIGPDGEQLSEQGLERYLTHQTTIANRLSHLDSNRQKELNQIAGDLGEWETLFQNISVSNDAGYKDTEFLSKTLLSLRDLSSQIYDSEGYKAGAAPDVFAYEKFKGWETLLVQQNKMADALKDWDKRIDGYGQELDKVKGDEAKYLGKAAVYIKDLNDYLVKHTAFIQDRHRDQLKKFRNEISVVTQGHHYDNLIDKIRLDDTFTSPEGQYLLELADESIATGIATTDAGEVARGINTVKTAIQKEFIHDRKAATEEQKEFKEFKDETLSALTKQAEFISTSIWGKGSSTEAEQKSRIHVDYKKGPLAIMQNPESILQKFTGSEASMTQAKVLLGQNISKLVKSSKFYKDENIKKLVDSTLAGTGDFVKQDELFDVLKQKWMEDATTDNPNKGIDLDFRGRGDKDKAAIELYKEYLVLYGILRERHEEAIGLFGTEYGYGKLQTPSSVSNPYGKSGEAISDAINKLLYPPEMITND